MNHLVKLTLVMVLAVVLVGCINIPLGDGNKLKISKDGVVFTDDAGDETNIALDQESGQLNISGGKEGEEIDLSVGVNLQVPEDFPADIPLSNDAMIIQAMKMTDGDPTISVIYLTNDEFDSIISLYDNFFDNSFTTNERLNDEESPYAGTELDMYMNTGERNDGSLVVTVLSNQETGNLEGTSEDYNATVTLVFMPNQE